MNYLEEINTQKSPSAPEKTESNAHPRKESTSENTDINMIEKVEIDQDTDINKTKVSEIPTPTTSEHPPVISKTTSLKTLEQSSPETQDQATRKSSKKALEHSSFKKPQKSSLQLLEQNPHQILKKSFPKASNKLFSSMVTKKTKTTRKPRSYKTNNDHDPHAFWKDSWRAIFDRFNG